MPVGVIEVMLLLGALVTVCTLVVRYRRALEDWAFDLRVAHLQRALRSRTWRMSDGRWVAYDRTKGKWAESDNEGRTWRTR